MSYPIEIVSLGEDLYEDIQGAAEILNASQAEFRFRLPPERLRSNGVVVKWRDYHTTEVFAFLNEYCDNAGGHRPFVIAVLNGSLRSDDLGNLFASRTTVENPVRHFAVVTVKDQRRFVPSRRAFLCYYLIRYSLSFVAPGALSQRIIRMLFR